MRWRRRLSCQQRKFEQTFTEVGEVPFASLDLYQAPLTPELIAPRDAPNIRGLSRVATFCIHYMAALLKRI
jgi:hypothetical protein